MGKDSNKIVGVLDIIFDATTREVSIRCGDGNVYLASANVERALRAATFCEMREVVGAGAMLEWVENPWRGSTGPGYVVVGFVKKAAAGIDDDGEPMSDVDRAIAASAAGASDDTPAEVTRPKLDRYGVAVEIRETELYAYPVDRRGAISPVGTLVTRPSPEFLADVNAALGTSLSLDDFPAAVVKVR